MQIIVVGCGKMGMELANRLVAEGHDVTVIDRSEAVLEHCLDTLDVMTVKGSGVSFDALTEADVKHADIVIASTMSDETNMLTCLTAKRLGAKYAIARIRDPEYLGSLSSLSKELSIDYVVNPERATAREISRILRLPFAVSIETFARGLVEMVEFRADGTEPFCGVTLDHYARTTKLPRVLFCAVERGHQPYIPKGDFTIQAGDAVFVAAEPATITEFFKGLGKNTRGAHNAMIVGGSRIAYYLAELLHDTGVKTTIVEHHSEKARWLSEALPAANIIHGDGTDQQLLLSEGLRTTDAFIALTDRDEENLMTGLYATQYANCKVIVKSTRVNYTEMLKNMGMDGIISPLQVACNIILRTVRALANGYGTAVERMYRIMSDKAEALEFIARAGAPYIGIPLRSLNIRSSALVAVIVRGSHVLVPFGDDTIEADDRVVIITCETGIVDLNDVMGQKTHE